MSFRDLVQSYRNLVDVGGLSDRDQLVNSIKDNFLNSFEESPNFYTIKYKDRITGIFRDIEVQIFDYKKSTSENFISDDFHRLFFKDFDQQVNIGDVFLFDNYHYMVINTDNIKSILQGCVIQRCNVQLKFIPDNNSVMPNLSSTPLVIDGIAANKISSPNGDNLIMLPSDQLMIQIPNDSNSRLIRYDNNGGTRFLLGDPSNYVCWSCIAIDSISKVRPTVEATPNTSNGIIEIKLSNSISGINELTDNLTYGIAKQNCY